MKLIRKGPFVSVQGITTYEYVVAMRAMSEAPAGSIDDDNQNVIYSPSGSATTGFSGGSSLGLQYKGAWCTPPRVFVDHQLRTLQGGHRALVGSLYWNKHILTIGGKDLMIIDNDVRIRSHHVRTYMGHKEKVYQLKWSNSGKQLASGGNDSLLYIWDQSMASLSSQTRCLHKFEDHVSTVKAITWCPHESNLPASSGSAGDQFIRFWNTQTGVCLNSINTGSQVCSLLWSKREKELLSSHGPTQNQLTLWKYPSMVKIVELLGHTSRALFPTRSPDSCMVASAAGDETLRIWNVFETPEVAKLTMGTTCAGRFSYLNDIR
ncbi:hypothetical protein AAC387_Pa11g0803 [Persea americana]